MSPRIKRCVGRPPAIDQDRLLQIAETHFAERGFEGASTRKLCQEAKCNLAMISYYFGSKEGLYQKVIERHVKKFVNEAKEQNLRPAPNRIKKSFSAAEFELYEILSSLSESICSNKNIHAIIMRELMTGSKRIIKALLDSDLGVFGVIQKKLDQFKAEKKISQDLNTRLAIVTLIGPIFYSNVSSSVIKSVYGFKDVDSNYMQMLSEHLTRSFFRAWGTTNKEALRK
ncbi:MAG: nicS [Bacteriovoracaceae bacterium]|nr:nicS [Bacteriovoracaceae bacterium]